jgi:ligand-binding SRPBCC domain-containing protein
VEHTLHRVQRVPTGLNQTFEFFSRPENLARITPSWLDFRLVSDDVEMRHGLRLEYRIRPLGFPQTWLSEITAYDPPHRFVDEQVRGPYERWHHEHRFRAVDGGTEVTDTVTYALPYGPIGRLAHALLVRRQLESIFDFRTRTLAGLLGSVDDAQ